LQWTTAAEARSADFGRDLAALQEEIDRELEPIKGDPLAMESVVREHEGEALSMLRRHHARTTRTDVNGGYVFKDVPIGRALVLAEWIKPKQMWDGQWIDEHYLWFLPVEVKRGENRLDLTGRTARSAFCPRRWEPGGPCN